MSNYLRADTTKVAVGPWYPVEVTRDTESWDLGSDGYDPRSLAETVGRPEQRCVESAARDLGVGAVSQVVQVVYTEQGE